MPHPVDIHVGKRIRHRRWLTGMTQQQLSQLAGIPRPTWANLESGSANPTLAVLVKAAALLAILFVLPLGMVWTMGFGERDRAPRRSRVSLCPVQSA